MSFRFLTGGESHGKALVGIIEGIPAGLPLVLEDFHTQMKRRKLGFGRGARQQIETDEVEILSGIRHGKTLGSPISLLVWNRDWPAWENIMQAEEPSNPQCLREVLVPRPGHADRVGGRKYGHRDLRNVLERSSARETAMRVALGTVARRLLEEQGILIGSRVVQIGSAKDLTPLSKETAISNDDSPVRCTNPEAEKEMVREILKAKEQGDTLGGIFEVWGTGIPVGLGSYVQWDRRIEGKIAQGLMSLNAIKSVEIGLGAESATRPGSQVHDEIFPGERPGSVYLKTNRTGGIEGGMTNGELLCARAAMKPLSTLMNPLNSVHQETGEAQPAHVERSDVCAVPAAAVIGESILALVLAEELLEKFGGDSLSELSERVQRWSKC